MSKNRLRQGYTTGTCAQAATKAAMKMLLSGEEAEEIRVVLPEGRELVLPVFDSCIQRGSAEALHAPIAASCAVKKDSGDDPDVTNGILVYSKVSWSNISGIMIAGGEGVGRVTKPGLEQPVGEAAINRVPRRMIEKEIRDALEETEIVRGIRVEISIPEGRSLALKTFNPRLGIEDGLSILGTSGIVEPMSEQALVDTIRVEIRVKLAEGRKSLVITPGNYGLDFLKHAYKIKGGDIVKCSNYIGQAIDMAVEEGCENLLLAGHIGKLIKVSGGIMNTHSKWADCRMELFTVAALRAGIEGDRAREFLDCVTTDDALEKCTETERGEIMAQVMKFIEKYLSCRAGERLKAGAIVYSNMYGILGRTENAESLIRGFCSEVRENRINKAGESYERNIIRSRSRTGRPRASYFESCENDTSL